MSDTRKIVNEKSVEWREMSHGDRFHFRGRQLGVPAGGRKLGCSLYELEPGKQAFPYHYHTANE